jgi:hypothetical protein
MFVAPFPHDDYIEAVAHQLTALGYEPAQWWTTTPDGEQLDGVIIFRGRAANLDLWTGKVWLGWDQRDGWALCDDTRTLFPLGLGTYAAPEVVAVRTRDRLMGRPDTIAGEDWNDADEDWDGAEALAEAVRAWESED